MFFGGCVEWVCTVFRFPLTSTSFQTTLHNVEESRFSRNHLEGPEFEVAGLFAEPLHRISNRYPRFRRIWKIQRSESYPRRWRTAEVSEDRARGLKRKSARFFQLRLLCSLRDRSILVWPGTVHEAAESFFSFGKSTSCVFVLAFRCLLDSERMGSKFSKNCSPRSKRRSRPLESKICR